MAWDAVDFVYLNGSKETAYNSLLVVWPNASHISNVHQEGLEAL